MKTLREKCKGTHQPLPVCPDSVGRGWTQSFHGVQTFSVVPCFCSKVVLRPVCSQFYVTVFQFFVFLFKRGSICSDPPPITLSVQLVFEVLLLQNLNSQPPGPPLSSPSLLTRFLPPSSQPDTGGRSLL